VQRGRVVLFGSQIPDGGKAAKYSRDIQFVHTELQLKYQRAAAVS
jgi:hypothetical protein